MDDLARAIDEAHAREDRAIAVVRGLLRCIDRKAYMAPEQQAVVREAEALLAEVGR